MLPMRAALPRCSFWSATWLRLCSRSLPPSPAGGRTTPHQAEACGGKRSSKNDMFIHKLQSPPQRTGVPQSAAIIAVILVPAADHHASRKLWWQEPQARLEG
jgi:hypothetical protein